MSELAKALQTHFGFSDFKPGQERVMECLLAGRSAAAVFPTGGGKSLCYQLPALLLPGTALVVSPLIALMKDQIDALAARGIAARRLDSTLDANAYRTVLEDLRSGGLKLLYVAPERFNNERFRETIARAQISLFAVDEAHCISEWGHNFRPDYLKLAGFARLCHARATLALTATATEAVLADICRSFEVAPDCAVRTGFYRSNLTLLATPIDAAARDAALLDRLRQRPAGPTIVYVTLQRTAEDVAQWLGGQGLPARAYHAGMDDEERSRVQDWFLASDRNLVVATIAFGMGIDKANIRYVYHYNLPKSLENYSQEIGRAGRDGAPSTCEMLACRDDVSVLENFVYGDTPGRASIESLVRDLFSQGAEFDVSHYELQSAHDIRMLVVRTLLTYLELDGYLEGGTPFYSEYQFKPLQSSAQILARFEGERRQFLADVFRQARKATTWFHLDLDQAVQAVRTDRERIVRALDYLAEQQLLELKAEGVRHRFRRLRSPDNLPALADTLYQRMLDRESREVARIQQVLDLVQQPGCQVAALGAHFHDPLDRPCGHCSWCINGGVRATLPPLQKATIEPAMWSKAVAFWHSNRQMLPDARALARFLCGVTSPKTSRARLGSNPLFGCFSRVPFHQVLEASSAEV